ncbi:hypothetical protein PoB_006805700 [Plakobranchus ocellatus]|uniref:FLYWCH-type domain-containing protein n=1 Tax=Plakobranchus ocellatus TaxID=259542 RepID=A0AAV4DBB8_9GAST|nr:hypothetical protein PoB_006805700 [Plakobranchus ocellatus]
MWKCLEKKCLSTCSTNIEMTSLLRTPGEHNHPATDTSVISRDGIRASCKWTAKEEINDKAYKIACTKTNKTGIFGIGERLQESRSETGMWLKTIFALPPLLADEIEDAFMNSLMSHSPKDLYALKVADYVLKHYIEGFSEFPLQIWAATDENDEGQTTK